MPQESQRIVLVAHPSADLYGSDLQLLESVRGLVAHGWGVVVSLPGEGPLVERLRNSGAEVEFTAVPVLRKALLSPSGLLRLGASSARALPALGRRLRELRPDVLYVNTVTVPLWLAAARLARVPALCHVHEAERTGRTLARLLSAPLLAARTVAVNSRAAQEILLQAIPRLAPRTEVLHNGIEGPPAEPPPVTPAGGPRRLVLVGRLSPRKGIDVALEAVALLRQQGRDVQVELCGSVFPGYEWYERQLRDRAARPDLAGAVIFAGYVSPTWPALARAEVALVPSRAEPFGNAAGEAQLAGRPVVVSAVQGLQEIVTDGETGLLVPPDDPAELAAAVARLLDDAPLASALAAAGRESARHRFSPQRYHAAIADLVARTAGR